MADEKPWRPVDRKPRRRVKPLFPPGWAACPGCGQAVPIPRCGDCGRDHGVLRDE